MESSPIRRVRQRTDPGPDTVGTATRTGGENVTLLPPPQHAEMSHSAGEDQHCHEREGEQTRDDTHGADPGHSGQAEEDIVQDDEGDSAALMQRTKKRKRGSPEPAPRPAGSTASFSWRTLRPPRGTPGQEGEADPYPRDQLSPKQRLEQRGRSSVRTITRGKKRKKSHFKLEGEEERGPGALSHPPHSQMMRKSPAERNTIRHYDVPSVWGRRVKSLRTRPWDSMPTRWKPFKLNGTHVVRGSF